MDTQIVTDVITNNNTVKLFITIVSSGLVFYIGAIVQNYLRSLVALSRVVGSFRISKNNILRFETQTGYSEGKILAIDRKRVEIEFDEYIKTIPTKIFADMTWNVVKNPGHLPVTKIVKNKSVGGYQPTSGNLGDPPKSK